MYGAAATASPLSYSQTCDTFRPRRAVFITARRAGLGRTAFLDLFESGTARNRLVLEPVSEGRPGLVVDALCHPGSGESDGRHVADRDVVKPAHEFKRELVLEVCTG